MYGKVNGAVLLGLSAALIKVETDARHGLPGFDMVGLLSSEVREARERVKTALANSGFLIPALKITTNLSPADLRKQGNYLDLPIAVSVLAALGELPCEFTENTIFIGELGLDGSLRPVNGLLAIMDSILETHPPEETVFFVPSANEQEISVLLGKCPNIFCFSDLSGLICALSDFSCTGLLPIDHVAGTQKSFPGSDRHSAPSTVDFADIYGQESLKRAAEIAAAGMHNLLMTGMPGAGKTMIANAIPGILPPMSLDEQIEVTKIYSAGGLLEPGSGLILQRPFRAPHHSCTPVALSGGGTGNHMKPGEVSFANRGVLFLDEFPEFRREAVEILRQPLESGSVTLSRANASCTYPARIMLVAARNPCPCGFFPDRSRCLCSEKEILNYQKKISGPILDRIDLFAQASPVSYQEVEHSIHRARAPQAVPESSADIRRRVEHVHEIQSRRYSRLKDIYFNSQLPVSLLPEFCPLDSSCRELLERIYQAFALSARGCHRLVRIARTIADLSDSPDITTDHLAEAVQYRPGL